MLLLKSNYKKFKLVILIIMEKNKSKSAIHPPDPLPQRNYNNVSPKFGANFPHM